MSDARDPWAAFLATPSGAALTAAERLLLRTRLPLMHRAPSVVMYQVLLMFHRGMLQLSELERIVDENEALDRSIEQKGGREAVRAYAATVRQGAETTRPALRLVRPDDKP